MPFRVARVVSSNPINLINAHTIHKKRSWTMRIEVKWITARSYGKQKWHPLTSRLGWKGKIVGLDIASQNVP